MVANGLYRFTTAAGQDALCPHSTLGCWNSVLYGAVTPSNAPLGAAPSPMAASGVWENINPSNVSLGGRLQGVKSGAAGGGGSSRFCGPETITKRENLAQIAKKSAFPNQKRYRSRKQTPLGSEANPKIPRRKRPTPMPCMSSHQFTPPMLASAWEQLRYHHTPELRQSSVLKNHSSFVVTVRNFVVNMPQSDSRRGACLQAYILLL